MKHFLKGMFIIIIYIPMCFLYILIDIPYNIGGGDKSLVDEIISKIKNKLCTMKTK